MSEEVDYTLSKEAPAAPSPPAAARAATGPPTRPPRGFLWGNGVMDLQRGAIDNPPHGTIYRSYSLPPSVQPQDSRRFSIKVGKTKTFFARVRDSTGRT